MKKLLAFVAVVAVSVFMVTGCGSKLTDPAPAGGGSTVDAAVLGTWQLCETTNLTVIADGYDYTFTADSMIQVGTGSNAGTRTVLVPTVDGQKFNAEDGNMYASFMSVNAYMYDYTIASDYMYVKTENTDTYTAVTKDMAIADGFILKKKP